MPSDRERPRPAAQRPSRPTPAPAAPVAPIVRLRVRRQDGPERVETRRWEEFDVAAAPGLTVAGALRAIAARPVTAGGVTVAPVAWDGDCTDLDCGACTLLIDGRPRPACGTPLARVARSGRAVTLEPLAKFPLVRDLVVDRARHGDVLRQLDPAIELGPERAVARPPAARAPDAELARSALGRCTGCCACLEVCPQYGPHADYVGAAAIARVAFAVSHETGALTRRARVEALMVPGGVADCGKAEACVEVCPQEIPLVDALQAMGRATSRELLLGWLLG